MAMTGLRSLEDACFFRILRSQQCCGGRLEIEGQVVCIETVQEGR